MRGGAGLYYEIFVGGNYQNSTQQNGVSQTQPRVLRLQHSDHRRQPRVRPIRQRFQPRTQHSQAAATSSPSTSHYKTPSSSTPACRSTRRSPRDDPHRRQPLVARHASHQFHRLRSEPQRTDRHHDLRFAGRGCDRNRAEPRHRRVLGEGRLTPALGQINTLISPGIDNYNSLFVQLNRQAAKGLNFIVSYTLVQEHSERRRLLQPVRPLRHPRPVASRPASAPLRRGRLLRLSLIWQATWRESGLQRLQTQLDCAGQHRPSVHRRHQHSQRHGRGAGHRQYRRRSRRRQLAGLRTRSGRWHQLLHRPR